MTTRGPQDIEFSVYDRKLYDTGNCMTVECVTAQQNLFWGAAEVYGWKRNWLYGGR